MTRSPQNPAPAGNPLAADIPEPVAFAGLDDVRRRVGEHVGSSRWVRIGQPMIDTFGDVTFDRNWIHCDPERAAATPFGGTIAHGYHSLALIGGLIQEVLQVQGTSMALNYGISKARFPAPVPVGAAVRVDITLAGAADAGTALDVTWHAVVEIEGTTKPACAADIVFRYFGPQD